MFINTKYYLGLLLVSGIVMIGSCRKLPEVADYLSPNAQFTKSRYEPVLGRNKLELTQFSPDASSYPLNFELQNLRRADGSPAPELTELIKVKDWIAPYTGLETSIAEIEAKRKEVDKPFFSIRPGSGDFVFAAASSSAIRSYPDSSYLFDINISTKTGVQKTVKDQKLIPLKEIPTEPTVYTNVYTRTWNDYVRASSATNLYHKQDSVMLTDKASDHIRIYFVKKGTGNSLTFKFFDKDSIAIDPAKFSLTKWNELVHGFNMQMTATEVKYDVAYPIPLTGIATKYASNGRASVKFEYPRRGFGNIPLNGSFGFNFSIFEAGDWEIVFKFNRNIRFQNE